MYFIAIKATPGPGEYILASDFGIILPGKEPKSGENRCRTPGLGQSMRLKRFN